MNREERFINNRKQDKIILVNSQPSRQTMRDGEEALYMTKGRHLVRYRKERGILWSNTMSMDGNLYVEKEISSESIKYSNKFIDYRSFIHNFTHNMSTTEHFVPWQGAHERTDMNHSDTSYLAPFNMTCHKILLRPETLTDATADVTFAIKKQDNGSTTVDSVATFTYSTTLASDTLITVNKSDWDSGVTPYISSGTKVGLSIDFSADPASTIDWYITSIWRIEVEI